MFSENIPSAPMFHGGVLRTISGARILSMGLVTCKENIYNYKLFENYSQPERH